MKKLKVVFMSVLIGLLIGLWLGVNIGKGKPNIFANPFENESLQDKFKRKVGASIEQFGEGIQGKPKK